MSATPQLSVVVPVHNEEDNVAPLVGEIVAALRGRIDFEIVYVDDTSKDGTLARLRELGASAGVRELHGEPESMVFALPKELRLRLVD